MQISSLQSSNCGQHRCEVMQSHLRASIVVTGQESQSRMLQLIMIGTVQGAGCHMAANTGAQWARVHLDQR